MAGLIYTFEALSVYLDGRYIEVRIDTRLYRVISPLYHVTSAVILPLTLSLNVRSMSQQWYVMRAAETSES